MVIYFSWKVHGSQVGKKIGLEVIKHVTSQDYS